jgi:hypothetical protein
MVDNPWSEEHWSITAQGAYVKQYGLSVAQRKARQAGVSIGALKPASSGSRVIERQWILSKRILGTSGGGGSSSDGPPS